MAENEGKGAPEAPRRKRRGCGGLFFSVMIVCSAVCGGFLGASVWVLEDAKTKIKALDNYRPKIGSKVYSSDGQMLHEFFNTELRQLMNLNEIPVKLQKAFLAREDDKFYEHRGVRPDAVLNALWYYLRTGKLRGGSTITQQLARNIEKVTGVSRERNFDRKLKEAIVSLQIERQFTKDEILELYLNQIFLGGSAAGVEAAAQQYFGRSCRDLTLGECAILAGLTKSPNRIRPDRFPDRARAERDVVLGQMLDNQFITQAEYEVACEEPIKTVTQTAKAEAGQNLTPVTPNGTKAPYFVEEVRKFMLDWTSEAEVFENGLEINTTIDMRLQTAAEETLYAALRDFDEKKLAKLREDGREDEFMPVWGALVCMDNRPGREGYVRALVGGRNFELEKFNTATQAWRQPGSSVKPFVWAAALDAGMTPSHIELDEEFEIIDGAGNPWSPENFSDKFLGPITLRHALEKSVNIISIKLVQHLGIPTVRSYMERAGMRPDRRGFTGLAVGLGSAEVTPFNLCTAYSTFANGGVRVEPTLITEVKDRDSFPIYRSTIKKTPAISPDVAYAMTYLMQGVCTPSTGYLPSGWRSRDLRRPRAGKTGTTNKSRNVWFSGFTPDYTCVVWMGYKNSDPLAEGKEKITGGSTACPIWTQFMIKAHEGLPPRDFEKPEGYDIQFHNVNRISGLRGGDFSEVFIRGAIPPKEIPFFYREDIVEEPVESFRFEPLPPANGNGLPNPI